MYLLLSVGISYGKKYKQIRIFTWYCYTVYKYVTRYFRVMDSFMEMYECIVKQSLVIKSYILLMIYIWVN